jgi:hypothetical protein
MINLDEQGCIRLVNGIVKKAVQDWRIAKKQLFSHPDNERQLWMLADCERFFLSPLFGTLTDMDGKVFLDKLEEEWAIEERRLKMAKDKKVRDNGKGKVFKG